MSDRDEDDRYRQGGFGSGMAVRQRPAVVVVDFQLGFTDPASDLGMDLDAEVEATRTLLSAARAANAPVAFTVISFSTDLSDLGLWREKSPAAQVLTIGSPWVKLDPRLERRTGEPVVVKQAASGCFGTTLVSLLVGWNADSVVLAGATTSGCVRATAVDLFQYGFPTLVARECVGDRFERSHEAALFDINAKYADVVSVGSACARLSDAVAVR
jgi:nicotinamidase-related amidase